MKAQTCLFLMTVAMMIATPGRGFAQNITQEGPHLFWAEIGGAGGTLEGITRGSGFGYFGTRRDEWSGKRTIFFGIFGSINGRILTIFQS
jgi:hypothetical protein